MIPFLKSLDVEALWYALLGTLIMASYLVPLIRGDKQQTYRRK